MTMLIVCIYLLGIGMMLAGLWDVPCGDGDGYVVAVTALLWPVVVAGFILFDLCCWFVQLGPDDPEPC